MRNTVSEHNVELHQLSQIAEPRLDLNFHASELPLDAQYRQLEPVLDLSSHFPGEISVIGTNPSSAITSPVSNPAMSRWEVKETPQRMREIVRNLNKLIADYSKFEAAVNHEWAEAKKRAESALKQASLDQEAAKSAAKARREAAEGEGSQVQQQIGLMRAKTAEHLKKQSEEYLGGDLLNAPSDTGYVQDPLNDAKAHVSMALQAHQRLLEVRKPENVIWPNNAAVGCGGLLLAFVAALIVGKATDYPLAGFFLFFGVYIAFIIALYQSASSALKEVHETWLQAVSTSENCLSQYQRSIEANERSEVEAAHGRFRKAQEEHTKAVAEAEARYNTSILAFKKEFSFRVRQAHERCDEFTQGTAFAGASWIDPVWDDWAPTSSPTFAACLGRLSTKGINVLQPFRDLNLNFTVPALVPLANGQEGRCLLFKADGAAKERAFKAAQAVMLRLLATTPSGNVRFTLIDPVGLGQNVAAFMSLADVDEKLIGGKAWTEQQHIEQQLVKLTEHMENVIQKYLRNEYATIEDYNAKAGEVAEPYRVLVVFDFPTNFTETAARRLVSIAQNGPRCGVYTIVVMDAATEKFPYGFNPAELERAGVVINHSGGQFKWEDDDFKESFLALDEPPNNELFKRIVAVTGAGAKDAMKVEVPYDKLLSKAGLSQEACWKQTAEKLLQVPLGPRGAKDVQYLTFGQGTAHHAVVVGGTGSGKSNLMHVIITTLALAYPPDEVQLYLIDFKQGVAFKPYAEAALPHARVIAIESEREFGLSVLEGLDKELHDRGELFRNHIVDNITDYRQLKGKLPRILLLVDEFQEFFVQDDHISRRAGMILERLVRQGRSAGIHVMLGSQTLGGASNLSHSIISQMHIRIALKCSEADSRQVMGDGNPVHRQLTRPGEAIYNAERGEVEGNNLFQVALFNPTDRERYLKEIRELASVNANGQTPVVFEGNEPSRIEDCKPLNALLKADDWPARAKGADAWLGEPIALRPPTAARFRRQGGNHLMVIARDEQEGVGMITASLLSLAAQYEPSATRLFVVNLTTADSPWSDLPEKLAGELPHEVVVVGRRNLPGVLSDLVKEINRRVEEGRVSDSELYLVIIGLHRARDLRVDEPGGKFTFGRGEERPPDPQELFTTVLRDGPEVGVHVIAWCDSFSNVKRSVDRKMMGEFGIRIASAMSTEDSSSFIDDAAAARLDKPHRAIFFDEERPGYLEKFRPYAIPDQAWLVQVLRTLRARAREARYAQGEAR